jgi:PAS domain S-box-containing protein/putative nucleotidyltransferase with HDIG domain
MNSKNLVLESEVFNFINNNSKDIFFRLSKEGKILYINNAVTSFGYTPDQLIGKPFSDIVYHEDSSMMVNLFKNQTESSEDFQDLECRVLTADKQIKILQMNTNSVRSQNLGSGAVSQGIARDITKKRNIEKLLYEINDGNLAKLRGSEFLSETTKYISENYGLKYCFIGKFTDNKSIETLALSKNGEYVNNKTYSLDNSPCEKVLNSGVCLTFDHLNKLFSGNQDIEFMDVNYYIGIPLINSKDKTVGVLTGFSDKPIIDKDNLQKVFQNFKTPIALKVESMTLIENIVDGFSDMLKANDPYTLDHQNEVAHLSVKIGQKMGLSQKDLEILKFAAKLHDIGKNSIPSQILSKPGKLTDNEFALVKDHVINGYELIKHISFTLDEIPEIVLQHHEKLDGSGYPRGLSGEQIHPLAQILTVADVFNAMATDRPYRKGLGLDVALNELNKNVGIKFSSEVVEALWTLYREDTEYFISEFCTHK